jgi:hypothetical protein
VVKESGSGEKEPRDFARVDRLAQLGTLPHMSRGTGVSVREINDLFFAVGAMRPEIAALFGWTQGNVWLHERDRVYIAATKRVFPDLLAAIEELLANPLSVHMDQRSAHAAIRRHYASDIAAARHGHQQPEQTRGRCGKVDTGRRWRLSSSHPF